MHTVRLLLQKAESGKHRRRSIFLSRLLIQAEE
jgi:hypothetical protein